MAPGEARPLYQVLEQQQAQVAQGSLMGSDHTYVIPPAGETGDRRSANVKRCVLRPFVLAALLLNKFLGYGWGCLASGCRRSWPLVAHAIYA